jgi:DNA polymerase III psi subunit
MHDQRTKFIISHLNLSQFKLRTSSKKENKTFLLIIEDILTLLDKPFDDLSSSKKELFKNIILSIRPKTSFEKTKNFVQENNFFMPEVLEEIFDEKISLIINMTNKEFKFLKKIQQINSPKLDILENDVDAKEMLWKKLKPFYQNGS